MKKCFLCFLQHIRSWDELPSELKVRVTTGGVCERCKLFNVPLLDIEEVNSGVAIMKDEFTEWCGEIYPVPERWKEGRKKVEGPRDRRGRFHWEPLR